MSNNINDRILARAFNPKEVLVDIDSTQLPDLYKKVYDYIEKVFVTKDRKPSLKHVRDVVIKGKEDENVIRKILTNLPEDDTSVDNEELKEQLHMEHIIGGIYDYMSELEDAVAKREFNKVSDIARKIEGLTVIKSKTFLRPDNHIFIDPIYDEPTKFISTGINSGHKPLDEVPECSVVVNCAATGLGKSMLALKAINHRFFYEHSNELVYSYEVQKSVLVKRLVSNLTGVTLDEIDKMKFLTKENEELYKKGRLAYVHEVMPEELKTISLAELEKRPKRNNVIKFRTSPERIDHIVAKAEGEEVMDMPHRKKLIEEVKIYVKSLKINAVTVDLLTSVPDEKGQFNYETTFGTMKDIKNIALQYGLLGFLPAQPRDEKDPMIPKYATNIKDEADLFVPMIQLEEYKEYGIVHFLTGKARHNKQHEAFAFEDRKACANFEADKGLAPVPMWEILNKNKKEKSK